MAPYADTGAARGDVAQLLPDLLLKGHCQITTIIKGISDSRRTLRNTCCSRPRMRASGIAPGAGATAAR